MGLEIFTGDGRFIEGFTNSEEYDHLKEWRYHPPSGEQMLHYSDYKERRIQSWMQDQSGEH